MPTSRKCASCYRYTTNPTWCGVCVHGGANRAAHRLVLIVTVLSAALILWLSFGKRATVTVAHGAPCPADSHFIRTIDPGDVNGARAVLRDVCEADR